MGELSIKVESYRKKIEKIDKSKVPKFIKNRKRKSVIHRLDKDIEEIQYYISKIDILDTINMIIKYTENSSIVLYEFGKHKLIVDATSRTCLSFTTYTNNKIIHKYSITIPMSKKTIITVHLSDEKDNIYVVKDLDCSKSEDKITIPSIEFSDVGKNTITSYGDGYRPKIDIAFFLGETIRSIVLHQEYPGENKS